MLCVIVCAPNPLGNLVSAQNKANKKNSECQIIIKFLIDSVCYFIIYYTFFIYILRIIMFVVVEVKSDLLQMCNARF